MTRHAQQAKGIDKTSSERRPNGLHDAAPTLVLSCLNSIRNRDDERFAPFSFELDVGSEDFFRLGIVLEGG